MTIKKETYAGDFLYSGNEDYIAELYEKYLQNPSNVSSDWQAFFANLGDRRPMESTPQWSTTTDTSGGVTTAQNLPKHTVKSSIQDADQVIAFQKLIEAYRTYGHTKANLDPLNLAPVNPAAELINTLDPQALIPNEFMPGQTVGQIIEQLETIYCQNIGYEYMHLEDAETRRWIQSQAEQSWRFESNTQKEILKLLTEASLLESFLHAKYVGAKRFSIEGLDSILPALEHIVSQGVTDKVEKIILGMPHRGRVNILANIVGKPLESIFQEFEGHSSVPKNFKGTGDVKYHLGYAHERKVGEHNVYIEMLNNPAHLESIDGVLLGAVRAHQAILGEGQHEKVLGILLHGDAAFSSQGPAFEALMLSNLPQYTVGGVLHIVMNNQIGFTTGPELARSTRYASDSTKIINAPVFHVNGDKPEAVMRCIQLAYAFRQTFKRDAVVEVWGYRKYGHNETDDPSFTQPLMYQKIDVQPSVHQQYQDQLLEQGVITATEVEGVAQAYDATLEQAFKAHLKYTPKVFLHDWKNWNDQLIPSDVSLEELRQWGLQSLKAPEGFMVHKRLERVLTPRQQALESGNNVDWATAEMLAFGSLVARKIPVRLSGQDSGRGTFSQRHAIWDDQQTGVSFVPLNHVAKTQALFEICDSPLSEAAVLGFEYGYSITNPHQLTLWEAQFGDFANGAEVVIDQYIAAGEAKWGVHSGLVLLLPHGYEGMGPEHSSGRLERFLQLYASYNIIVANCTTPANYFHLLRRQVLASYRKPLIVMTPKSLLRHKLAVSNLKEMAKGSVFHPILEDTSIPPKLVQRVVLCSGKVYYDLLEQRKEQPIALIRVEQLAPFPKEQLVKTLRPYAQAEIVWCQEEPKNMGAWSFVAEQMEEVLTTLYHSQMRPFYLGRPAAAAPATGFAESHMEETRQLLQAALTITPFQKRKVKHGH